MPAHDRDDAWSDPAPVSGAGIEPASHRARAARGRHTWTRNSGEWRQRERTGDWTGPKHSSGEWPTLHLDAARDSGDLREPELFSSDWPTPRPAEPRWTAQDWTAADSTPRREAASRRIDWLDGPELDDTAPSVAGDLSAGSAPDWAALADRPEPAAGADHAEGPAAGWSVSLWDDATKAWDDDATKAWDDDATKAWDDDATKAWDQPTWDHKAGEKADDHWAWDDKAGDEKANGPDIRDTAVGGHRIRAEANDDGWTDEDWQRLGDAPTEELFTRRSTPRSHRRPEPMRKVTLRVLAAVLVAGGGVGLTLNLVSADGSNPPAQTRVEDQNAPRYDGSVAPTQSASPTPTDPQTTSQADAATQPLVPATTQKASAPKSTSAPAAPAPAPATTTPAPAPTTTAPATTPPTTTPAPTTPPPTTEPTPAPTTSAPPASSDPASGQPTP